MSKPILKKATSIFEEEAPKKKVDPKKAVKVLESSIKSLKTARMSLVGIKSKLKEEDGENPNEAVDALADTIDSIESAISDIIDATSATNPAVQTLIGTVDTLEAEKDNAEIDAMLSGEGDEFTEETEDDEEEEETAEEDEEDEKKEEGVFKKKTLKENDKNKFFVVANIFKGGNSSPIFYIQGKPDYPMTLSQAEKFKKSQTPRKDRTYSIVSLWEIKGNPKKYIVGKSEDGSIITMANYKDYDFS